MTTVKELYELIDKEKSGLWSLNIYDLAGMVSFGHCNSKNPVTGIPNEILEKPVEKFTLGYESISVRIDMSIKAVYESEDACIRDGYQPVYGRKAWVHPLYSKKVDGMSEFAVVDFLASIRKEGKSSK